MIANSTDDIHFVNNYVMAKKPADNTKVTMVRKMGDIARNFMQDGKLGDGDETYEAEAVGIKDVINYVLEVKKDILPGGAKNQGGKKLQIVLKMNSQV